MSFTLINRGHYEGQQACYNISLNNSKLSVVSEGKQNYRCISYGLVHSAWFVDFEIFINFLL
jgi:hypothetical protein